MAGDEITNQWWGDLGMGAEVFDLFFMRIDIFLIVIKICYILWYIINQSDLIHLKLEEPQPELWKQTRAYLWPGSKCWMRASGVNIQRAATKVTDRPLFAFRVRLSVRLPAHSKN